MEELPAELAEIILNAMGPEALQRVKENYARCAKPLHYTLDPESNAIVFKKETRTYRRERDVFRANGIDIDTITDEDIYWDIVSRFRHELMAVWEAALQSKPVKTPNDEFLLALNRGDFEAAEYHKARMEKRRKLGLKVVQVGDNSVK